VTEKQKTNYAHLPDELIAQILNNVPQTVQKMNRMFDIQDEPIAQAIKELRDSGKISTLKERSFSSSLIAADGGMVIEKMTGSDLLLAVAVGVEGLTEDSDNGWEEGKNQYYQWQTALSHNEANARLGQGVMFLMELSVLASASHDIRIMDGTHFTPLLKINSMLSANGEDNTSAQEYANALRDFLKETYEKIIPDIPEIITAAFNDEKIIALAKYSSSRDVLDAFLAKHVVKVDDRTFFSLAMDADEYLIPLSVGQSDDERGRIWNDLHIRCNLDIPERDQLNESLKKAINPLRTKDIFTSKHKESEIYFTYFKPYQDGPAYRIEMKKALATDKKKFEICLSSLKRQIVFPEIREPFP
jgi:hypothetical protein